MNATLPRHLLTPEFFRAVQLEKERRDARKSLATFAKQAWHILEPATPLKWGWALDAICAHLEAVTNGDVKRLLMNVPPGMMKSMLTGVIWPAWEWGPREMPSMRYLSTAHKQDLAVRDNLKCRRLIQSDWYQERWPIALVGDQNAKTKFENDSTGFREAMAFTSMTGSRGNRVILDDPLSVDGAKSDAELAATETTFREALPTRVNDDESAIVVIMQRLHEKDPSGIIIKEKMPYVHLCLPMEFESHRRCTTRIGFTDPRTKEGELLFPERFSDKNVRELKTTMGEYATAGQLQQSPSPAGGGIIKVAHFQLWPHDRPLPHFDYIVQCYDTAFTEKTHNDPTACMVWATFTHRNVRCAMIIDAWGDRMQYPQLKRKVFDDWGALYGGDNSDPTNKPRRADLMLVEEKGSGISLLQDLQQARLFARGYNPGRPDKVARASVVTPILEADVLYVLESKRDHGKPVSWVRPALSQLERFPNDDHDDYVDVFSMGLKYLKDSGFFDQPKYEEPEEEVDYHSKSKARVNPYDA